MIVAFLACDCSVHLSDPGKPSNPRTFLRVHPDCAGDTTERLAAHEGLMATTTSDVGSGVQMIALNQIRTDANVRELAPGDVDALAGSIALLGQITPASVRPDGAQYVLVAGHKRYAALRQLGETEIRAEIRSAEAEHVERAAENLARSQLDPHQPSGIALDASFGRSDDAIASEFGRFWASRLGC
jgi:hypothetical protein